MIRGLYTSTSGMLTQQLNMDVISNNLSNVETNGYKKDTGVMSPFHRELLYHLDSTNILQSRLIGESAHGVQLSQVITSYGQGNIYQTGNPLDAAIDGDGFFVVQDGEEIKLTRNGSFKIDSEDYLVTGEGYRVLGHGGFIIIEDEDFTITGEGVLFEGDMEVDTLLLIDFENKDNLDKDGHTLFSAPQDLIPVQPQFNIKQGYLERSNVNTAQEIADLITTSKIYGANQRMVQSYDQILAQAVREIGNLK